MRSAARHGAAGEAGSAPARARTPAGPGASTHVKCVALQVQVLELVEKLGLGPVVKGLLASDSTVRALAAPALPGARSAGSGVRLDAARLARGRC